MIVVGAAATTQPPVATVEVLSTRLTVSLTEAEKTRVRSAANAAGLSMSAWARTALTARTTT